MSRIVVATAFGGPENLAVIDRPTPAPGPDEVTIRVRAAAVNPIDHLIFSGLFGADPAWLPLPVGQEVSGVVTAVGDGASGPAGPVEVGDEVIAYPGGVGGGGYAEEVTWAAHGVVPKPADLAWEPASGLLFAGGTAMHALVATGVASHDTVLIHGVAGAVGQIAAQIAVHRGARVIGTAAPGRHEALRGYGVEPVAYGDGLLDRVRALAPNGVDAAIDAIGTDEALDVSLAVVHERDRIATLVSFPRGNEEGIRTLGAGGGATDPGTEVRSEAWAELTALAADGKLEVPVTRTFSLEDAGAANELVVAGHAGGKVVLVP